MFLVDDDGLGPEDGGEVEQGEDADGVPHDAAAPVVPQLQVVAPQRLVVLLHLRHKQAKASNEGYPEVPEDFNQKHLHTSTFTFKTLCKTGWPW